jgi:fibronectin-binding autotransporter adhesin
LLLEVSPPVAATACFRSGKIMNYFSKFSLVVATSLALSASWSNASDWAGGSGNWSSDANPGWNGTGVPNGIGAVANFGDIVTGTTTQDIAGGVTVGTISLTSTANISRTITNTNGITMNQDGAGSGFATISNSNANTGTTNFLFISGGTLTLADDLLISNTGGSTNATGAIQISSVIAGTGNVTFSNVTNNLAQAGSIRVQTGVNTFVGSVLVQRGTVTYNNASSFGNSANVITVGQAGQGGATLLSTAGVTNPYNIVVTSGTGGSSTIGSTSTGAPVYSGSITLNGNVSIFSLSTNTTSGQTFSGLISGAGSVTKIGTGIARFTNTGNSYEGGTLLSAGTLVANGDGTLGVGNVSLTAAGVTLTLQNGAINNYIADTANLSIVSGVTVNLNFTGTDTIAGLLFNGSALAPGIYGSSTSGAPNQLAEFAGTGTFTVVPEPATYVLFGVGLLMCAQRFRRAKKQ